MANVTLMGASYSDVPAVTLPQTGGGTATFTDVSPTTAVDADVASGKIYFKADGSQSTGTGSGSGGGGLVYETGTYTPTGNVARPTISFSNQHTEAPICVIFANASQTQETESNSNTYCAIVNFEPVVGYIQYSSTTRRYGVAFYGYRASSQNSSTLAFTGSSSYASSSFDLGYWITNSAFMPYSNSTSKYWIAGRTYKWIAVWAPTT